MKGNISITPKVSVIMPVYNVEKYLRQALNSVLEQTLKDIEVICVDDGSSDESLNILREYEEKDRRIKVITQNNMHAGVARNNGMKVARGEYYAFLDSDDFFEPEMLEKEYNKCKKYDADICICGYDRYDVRTREFIRQHIPSKTDKECFNADSVLHIFGVTNPAPWNKLFSARFVKESGIEFQSLTRANDVFFTFSALVLARKIVAIREVYAHYRIGMGTNLQANNEATPDNFIKAFLALKDLLVEKGFYKDCVAKSYNTMLMSSIRYNLSTLEGTSSHAQVLHLLATTYWDIFSFHKWSNEDVYSKWGYSDAMPQILRTRAELVPEFIHKGSAYEGKDNLPEVSIIIPVYNAENHLKECLDSIVGQTYEDIEIICVNDGSLDNSLSIIEEYAGMDSRITVVTQKNKGRAASRNMGLSIAQGDYIIFVDGDDYIEENAIEELYKYCNKEELDVLMFGANTTFETDELACKRRFSQTHYTRNQCYEGVYTGSTLFCKLVQNKEYQASVCLQMFRRKHLVDRNILFIDGIIHEDNAFTFASLLEAERAAVCNNCFYHCRRSFSTMTREKKFNNVYGYLRCYKAVLSNIEQKDLDEETLQAACVIASSNRKSAQSIFNELSYSEKQRFYEMKATEQVEFSSLATYDEMREAKRELKSIKASNSYKIGRAITWLPRKVKKARRYYGKYGLKKTLKRIFAR